jgi:elongation factor 1 alpha-like protein
MPADRLTPPERALDLPLRMSVTDVFKSVVGGATIACTVVCGHIQTGDKIQLMPGSETGAVKGMFWP